jgi:(1->4)-alpha-D-glucan 1-alpha-D-glucosylmutase
VNYTQRREMLDSLRAVPPEKLLEYWPDGRIKLFLTQRLLCFRREHAALFQRGNYLPLNVSGTFADCCVAFVREHEGEWIAVFVPRLSSRVGFPPIGDRWKDTNVDLPESLRREGAKDVFTGRDLRADDGGVRISEALSILPFAVYTNQGGAV